MKVILLMILVGISFYPITVFAEPTITLDKNSYTLEDSIKVSGRVIIQEDMALVIQIRSPTDIVAIEQLTPTRSGTFSVNFDAIGPKWSESGQYTIIVSYGGEKSQKTFSFSSYPEKLEPVTSPIQEPTNYQKPPLKISIANFPDPALSPNYYINLYKTDIDFKKLFDTSFPGFQIRELVGYNPTHIAGFPDFDQSPQSYIERYTNEARFRIWFDSQFPNNTIYDIVDRSERSSTSIPSWIKQYALQWSSGKITDAQFASGITELIHRKILLFDEDIVIAKNTEEYIPTWFKNAAKWYSDGFLTDYEFLSGLQFLIEKEIILI